MWAYGPVYTCIFKFGVLNTIDDIHTCVCVYTLVGKRVYTHLTLVLGALLMSLPSDTWVQEIHTFH